MIVINKIYAKKILHNEITPSNIIFLSGSFSTHACPSLVGGSNVEEPPGPESVGEAVLVAAEMVVHLACH